MKLVRQNELKEGIRDRGIAKALDNANTTINDLRQAFEDHYDDPSDMDREIYDSLNNIEEELGDLEDMANRMR